MCDRPWEKPGSAWIQADGVKQLPCLQQTSSQFRLDPSENPLMDSEKQRDLGSWIGLQKAFAAVGGSCSAARAQCLKQVRDSHMLDDLGFTWEEFCKDFAGISRAQADHLIQQYA